MGAQAIRDSEIVPTAAPSMVRPFVSLLVASVSAERITLATFDGAKDTTLPFVPVNDPVMGGQSTSTFTLESNKGIFEGEVRVVTFLGSPGFCMLTAPGYGQPSIQFPDISGTDGIQIAMDQTKEEGLTNWDVTIQTKTSENATLFGDAFWQGTFKFESGKTSYFVPYSAFTCLSRGTELSNCGTLSTQLDELTKIGIGTDGVAGPFRAELTSIQAASSSGMQHAAAVKSATRKCPAYPASQAECPIKNITDPLNEFEPVCVKHFPQIGGQLAEYQTRRCMKGNSAPYYQDDQGVFRCSCCGAPLFVPSKQFDQEPASNWGWPSFHSPPIHGDDGLPNVCHVGKAVSSPDEADDLGLGIEGEVRCSHCGAHIGDYFDSDDFGKDHYCINGACMIPPGGNDGEVCQPSFGADTVV